MFSLICEFLRVSNNYNNSLILILQLLLLLSYSFTTKAVIQEQEEQHFYYDLFIVESTYILFKTKSLFLAYKYNYSYCFCETLSRHNKYLITEFVISGLFIINSKVVGIFFIYFAYIIKRYYLRKLYIVNNCCA